jgi:hypothetical protein
MRRRSVNRQRVREWWAGVSRFPAAQGEIEAWIRREPSNPLPLSILADKEASAGRHQSARSLWRRAIMRWHGQVLNAGPLGSLWEKVADASAALGDPRTARRALGHAAAAFRRGRKGRLLPLIMDDYRSREAAARIARGEHREAWVLLRQIRRGPNAAVFAEAIEALEQKHPTRRAFELEQRPASSRDVRGRAAKR